MRKIFAEGMRRTRREKRPVLAPSIFPSFLYVPTNRQRKSTSFDSTCVLSGKAKTKDRPAVRRQSGSGKATGRSGTALQHSNHLATASTVPRHQSSFWGADIAGECRRELSVSSQPPATTLIIHVYHRSCPNDDQRRVFGQPTSHVESPPFPACFARTHRPAGGQKANSSSTVTHGRRRTLVLANQQFCRRC